MSSFLALIALLLGGAIVLTLYAAFFIGRPGREAKPAPGADDAGAEGRNFTERLIEIAAKARELSQLIRYAESGGPPSEDSILPRQRRFLAYLLECADRYAALALERRLRAELDILLPLLEGSEAIGRLRAFRLRVSEEAAELASDMPMEGHPELDDTARRLLGELDEIERRIVEGRTSDLVASESPIANSAELADLRAGEKGAMEKRFSELDRAYDRFLAELELEADDGRYRAV